MRVWFGAAALTLLMTCLGSSSAWAQSETLEVRLESVARVRSDAARSFFDQLRKAVGQSDRAAACALLAYPLPHATGVVASAADCAARYDVLFTVPVRRAIGRQRFEEVFVGQQGVMLGGGEVWFTRPCAKTPCATATSATDLRVTALTTDVSTLLPPKGKQFMLCGVAGQKIRVAADGAGGAMLEVWYSPNLTGPAAREFPKASSINTLVCNSRVWTFKDTERTYTVEELPCDAPQYPPPMGSVGRVTLITAASTDGEALWCRDLLD